MTKRHKRFGPLLFSALCLSLFGGLIAANWPWIVAESRRLEPWKIPVMWLAEITGVVLLIEYGVRHAVARDEGSSRRALTLKAFLMATACDCGLSAYSIHEEELAHARAVQVHAEVVAGHSRTQASGHQRYTFTCFFTDQQGAQSVAWFSTLGQQVPDHLRTAIDHSRLPVSVTVAYDPRWPGRSWIADARYSHDNRLFIYSLLALMFSLPVAGGLALFAREYPFGPTPRIAPLLGSIAILLMAVLFQGGW